MIIMVHNSPNVSHICVNGKYIQYIKMPVYGKVNISQNRNIEGIVSTDLSFS